MKFNSHKSCIFKSLFYHTRTFICIAGFCTRCRAFTFLTTMFCIYFYPPCISSDPTSTRLITFSYLPLIPFTIDWTYNEFTYSVFNSNYKKIGLLEIGRKYYFHIHCKNVHKDVWRMISSNPADSNLTKFRSHQRRWCKHL